MSLQKQAVKTQNAPAAIGPYSQAVRVGQIPLNPQTGALIEGEIEQQTDQAIANLQAVLEAAGSGLAQVIKTTVFLKDMHDFGAMNLVYGKHFSGEGVVAPARSTVEVARLPKDVLVEIEAIALAD